MTYQTSVEARTKFKANIVIEIEGVYFGKHQVDSGLVIDADKLIVDSVTINPTKINIKKSTSTINSTKIRILDKNGRFSTLIGTDEGALVDKTISVYLGRVNESMDFSDYLKIHTYRIKQINKSQSFYDLRCVSQIDRMQRPTFTALGNLDAAISDSATTIVVNHDTDVFPSSGHIKIEDEIINYTTATWDGGSFQTTFTGITRGVESTTAVAHGDGTEVSETYKFDGVNPVDIFLQLMVSPGGGGSYDVLHSGVGIDQSLIDTTAIEAIRDAEFAGEVFTLWISNPESTLEWIEENILNPNNLRLIENADDNKVSLALLDQTALDADVFALDSRNTRPNPTWEINNNEIQNVLLVKYAWNEGLQKFTRSKLFKDDDSIAKYGETRQETLEIKGAQVADSGEVIATDRANRFLGRFSTPKVKIKVSAFAKASLVNVGEKVRISTAELPQEGGSLGLNSIVEVLSRAYNHNTGDVKFELIFTSYSNLRIGLIAPAPTLNSTIFSQRKVRVPDGGCYEIGYKIRLWNLSTQSFTADPVNTITEIDGNDITFENDFTTTLTSNYALRFADYDQSSAEQRGRYAYISPSSGSFVSDGAPGYKISI